MWSTRTALYGFAVTVPSQGTSEVKSYLPIAWQMPQISLLQETRVQLFHVERGLLCFSYLQSYTATMVYAHNNMEKSLNNATSVLLLMVPSPDKRGGLHQEGCKILAKWSMSHSLCVIFIQDRSESGLTTTLFVANSVLVDIVLLLA